MADEVGVTVEMLPPYSPDFNPIEETFHALKAFIRRNKDVIESYENFEHFLRWACSHFMAGKDAREYYRNANFNI
jgi:transposase